MNKLSFIKKISIKLFTKQKPTPLGRWNHYKDPFIKTDFASIDSGGDIWEINKKGKWNYNQIDLKKS